MNSFYVGLDWGNEKHAVCVMAPDGTIVGERMLLNDGAVVSVLAAMVGGPLAGLKVAVEARDLTVVDALVAAGCELFTVNPKQVDRFRDRYTSGGAKDDRRDARVLASALRTDPDAFRAVLVESETEMLIRLRGRALRDCTEAFGVVANQLRAQLARYFPAVLTLCPGANERWLWRLLRKASMPERAARLTERTLAALLQACRVRKLTAADLHASLRAERLSIAPGVELACAEQALRLVDQLELLAAQLSCAKKLRNEAVEQLAEQQRRERGVSDVDLVASMPGAGETVVATLFGEAAHLLRDRDSRNLRVLAGVAPITKASGKSHRVVMRRSRSQMLADALFHAARVASMNAPRFKELLARQRARGNNYARALRGVADRYIDVLCAVLRSGVPYDSSRYPKTA